MSVYIKAILPERMKIKLLAIDTLPPLNVPAPLEYFLTQGQIEKWKYAPEGCVKVGAEDHIRPEKQERGYAALLFYASGPLISSQYRLAACSFLLSP